MDDGLAILKDLSGSKTERIEKKVKKLFKDCELKIIIKANLDIVNFLGFPLDLRNNTYEPYRKPDSHPVYINKNANHPKRILRGLLKLISKDLSHPSSNKEICENATPMYFEAMIKWI